MGYKMMLGTSETPIQTQNLQTPQITQSEKQRQAFCGCFGRTVTVKQELQLNDVSLLKTMPEFTDIQAASYQTGSHSELLGMIEQSRKSLVLEANRWFILFNDDDPLAISKNKEQLEQYQLSLERSSVAETTNELSPLINN
jgi:hypothetical protein